MCMEDIRIGRKQSAQYYSVTAVANTPTLLVPANPKRVTLLLCNNGSQLTFVGPKEIITAINRGIALPTQSPVIVLRVEEIGDAIYQEWWFIAQVGTPSAFAISTELQDS